MTPKVFLRTYEKLKQEVTSGRYKPGQRLHARALADTLKASTSPVTNAMRQLVGEMVLEYTTDGFIIPWVNEQRLRDLFNWMAWLTTNLPDDLDLNAPEIRPPTTGPSVSDIVDGTERLFSAIAAPTQNAELIHWMGNANDRLRAIRHLEGSLIPDQETELTTLLQYVRDGSRPTLRRALGRYHKRRLDLVPQLVGLSYQDRH